MQRKLSPNAFKRYLSSTEAVEHVTPWKASAGTNGFNYTKLMNKFGCKPIDSTLIDSLQQITHSPAHFLFRRSAFFCHRDFDLILEKFKTKKEQNKESPPFYLYTGRGPSSNSLHLGHLIPFLMCKYLQDTFKVPLVIQITDDEKFLFRNVDSLAVSRRFALENIKDIISLGFDPSLTFIFCNSQYQSQLYPVALEIQRHLKVGQMKSVFGFDDSANIGQLMFPSLQMAPCFPTSFPHLFKSADLPCLVPYAIDQDPYFMLARDVASRLAYPKPASLGSTFFPSLQGIHSKMSASLPNSAIFLSDPPTTIQQKIIKHAYSGGRASLEEHRQYGGSPETDVAFQYLSYFLPDDSRLKDIEQSYRKGELLSSELKNICATHLIDFLSPIQEQRNTITDAKIQEYTRF